MLIEALRGEAASLVSEVLHLVNPATDGVASRQRTRWQARVATSVVAAGAALLLCAGTASRAQAQKLDTGEQRDFAFKVGVFVPADKQVRSVSATEIPAFEADYTIQKYPESHFNSILTVGYIEHEHFRMIPITVSQIYRDPENAAGVNYYYGLGAGVYATRLNLENSDSNDQSKTLIGGFVVAGIDVTKTIFGEVKYHLISRYDGKNVDGFQGNIGLRF